MLDSLRLHVSILGILILLQTISLASAYELSATPDHFTLRLEPNKKICKELRIEADSKNVRISTVWSPIKSRQPDDFTYTAQEQGLFVSLPGTIKNKGETLKVCVEVFDSYAYYGLILIEDEKVGSGLGVWLTINPANKLKPVPPQTQEESKRAPLTGNVVREKQDSPSTSTTLLLILSTLSTLLLATLALLVYRKKRQELSDNLY